MYQASTIFLFLLLIKLSNLQFEIFAEGLNQMSTRLSPKKKWMFLQLSLRITVLEVFITLRKKKKNILILNISMIYKLFRLQIWQMVFLYIYIHIFSNTWYELKMYTDDVMRYINDKSSIISCQHKHSKHLN